MKPLIVTLISMFALNVFSATTPSWQPSAGHTQIPLWPGTPPDTQPLTGPEDETTISDGLIAGKPVISVTNVLRPTMTVYRPAVSNTGAAVVVFPGGGYEELAIDLEGTEVCDWLTAKGIACVLLKYRVPDSGPAYHKDCHCHITPKAPTALQDAQRAIRLVREHAKEWGIDPDKIGVLGFSAGGHMVEETSTRYKERLYPPVDAADKGSCRPDFAVALYPGHLWTERKFELDSKIKARVNRGVPSTFLLQAEDDEVDHVEQVLVYYRALKDAGVETEMHLYAHGGHAFGLRRTQDPISEWPSLVEKWLATIGIIPALKADLSTH